MASSPDVDPSGDARDHAAGARLTAADAFAALYRLQALRRIAERAFASLDALVLPTAPTAYTVAQVLANPIELNSRLGTYTNFVNLLDLCGLALPAAMRPTACRSASRCWRPAGRTRCSPASAASSMPTPGCRSARKGLPQPPLAPLPAGAGGDEIAIAVVGAHLSGMALNGELKALGGRLLRGHRRPRRTTGSMRSTPRRRSPACCASTAGTGTSIEVEVWALSAAAFGKFVAAIPPPLSIGTRAACRRQRRERLSGRARRHRRARTSRVRRLARVHGGEGGGLRGE